MVDDDYRLPWKVWSGHLRPNPFNKTIVEVLDADNNVILPWGAFDHLDSIAAKKRLARVIVEGVNTGHGYRVLKGKR